MKEWKVVIFIYDKINKSRIKESKKNMQEVLGNL